MKNIKCICTSSLTVEDESLNINIPAPCVPFQNGDIVKVEICSRIPTNILPTSHVSLVIDEIPLIALDECSNLVQTQQIKCGEEYCFCINTEFPITTILNCLPKVCRTLPTIPPTPRKVKPPKK